MSTASLEPQGEYAIVSQTHANRFIPEDGQVVRGWWVSYRDNLTGVRSEVWVTDDEYPNAVPTAIMAEIRKVRWAHAQTGAAPSA